MKKTKTKPKQQPVDAQPCFRSLSVRAATVNEEQRSVEAVISTESPVPMLDWQRFEVIPEVLRGDGVEYPATRQIPLLDSHYPRSTANQLGSIRDLRVNEQGQMVGRLVFSSVADDAWTKVAEGHATDVSVGYQVLARTFVPEGKTQSIGGREYTGPVNVVTKWRSIEGSLTPIGADDQAKLRGVDAERAMNAVRGIGGATPTEEVFSMNEELRKLLVTAGMSADLDDEAAQKWLLDNRTALAEDRKSPEGQPVDKKPAGTDGEALGGAELNPQTIRQWLDESIKKVREDEQSARKQFRADVDGMLEIAGIGKESAARFYELGDLNAVRAAILEDRKQSALEIGHAPITFGAAQRDKHRGALQTAMLMKAIGDCVPDSFDENSNQRRAKAIEKIFPESSRSKDWTHFQHAGLYDMARECLIMDGVDVRGKTRDDIAAAALGFGDKVGIRTDASYHITGSFPYLTQDAINKSMMLGYMEYPSTWRGPMKQGQSVQDFKKIHRMQIGALPNIPTWSDRDDPNQVSFADAEETYGIECKSAMLTLGYKLLVNDDRSALSSAPFKFGAAMARTVNAQAWAQITGNPTMRDSVALFATATGPRKRDNLQTGSATPTTTTVGAMTKLMMLMRGENTPEGNESDDILGLMPRYIVGPAALRTTILQLVLSISDPASSNAGVVNLNNNLIPVIEPLLDASSATAWYLFAEPTMVETVEVTFLQGQETPKVRTILNPYTLSQEHIVLQTFGAKALDHRGMQKHAGA